MTTLCLNVRQKFMFWRQYTYLRFRIFYVSFKEHKQVCQTSGHGTLCLPISIYTFSQIQSSSEVSLLLLFIHLRRGRSPPSPIIAVKRGRNVAKRIAGLYVLIANLCKFLIIRVYLVPTQNTCAGYIPNTKKESKLNLRI